MKQLTKKQAIEFWDLGIWKDWNAKKIVRFQLFQKRLRVPFSVFQLSMDKVLSRLTWTHEYAYTEH